MIKDLLNEAVPRAVGAVVGSVQNKIDEFANRAVSQTTEAWGSFKKLLADGKDNTVTSANTAFRKFEIENGYGPSEAEVDEMIREMSPLGEGTALDAYSNEAQLERQLEGQFTAAQVKSLIGQNTAEDQSHKVKLVEKGVDQVVFDIMPEVTENRNVEYEAVAPPQSPSAFQKYKGTTSTQWTVQATLTCRNTDEATENLRKLNVLRGWTMPFFGENTRVAYPDKLGAPPPVLEFSGWRNQMVGPVQVVITSLSWNFPQDVDYIPAKGFTRAAGNELDYTGELIHRYSYTGELIPFPAVIKLQITLVESFSTEQLNSFDLAEFRAGRFDKAFVQTVSSQSTQESTRVQLNAPGVAAEEAQTVVVNSNGSVSSEVTTQVEETEKQAVVSEVAEANVSQNESLPAETTIQRVGNTSPAAPGPTAPPPGSTEDGALRQKRSQLTKDIALAEQNAVTSQQAADRYTAKANQETNSALEFEAAAAAEQDAEKSAALSSSAQKAREQTEIASKRAQLLKKQTESSKQQAQQFRDELSALPAPTNTFG